ncbi:MAG: right-handed parallel beta-helix repeat-containing protein, partial [Candidatus Hodarchaeales archaeon]
NNTVIAEIGSSSAIGIYRSSNSTIQNNSVEYNGISVSYSESCKIINNTIIEAKDIGFLIDSNSGSSSYGMFINNTVKDCKYAITINAKYTKIVGNHFFRSTMKGIRFWAKGTEATIANNTFIEDGMNFENGDTSLMLTLEVENNRVNGFPLGFYKSMNDILIDSPHGQVILVDCDNVTVTNQNCSFTSTGIAVFDSTNCKINNSVANNNIETGIDIESSPSTVISSCICESTTTLNQDPAEGYGIKLWSSGSSILYNNTCKSNHGGGIYVYQSSFSGITDNYCTANENFGIKVELSLFVDVLNNNLTENSGSVPGIFLWNTCDQALVSNNSLAYEYIGIQVENICNDVVIENNTLKSIDQTAIYVHSSTGNKISNNSIESHTYGIYIYGTSQQDCDNTEIANNTITIIENVASYERMAIKVTNAPNIEITSNFVIASGIYIEDTYNDYSTATIQGNLVNNKPLIFLRNNNSLVFDSNNPVGQLILINCNNITISDQNFSKLWTGIFIYQSVTIEVLNTTLESNTYGINAHDFDDSVVIDSRFAYNHYGVKLLDSTNNIFYGNTFLTNTYDLDESNSATTLYNPTTNEGNYWSSIPPSDPYGRGVVPSFSSKFDEISCNKSEIQLKLSNITWQVSDDNLAYYEILIDDVMVTTGNLSYRAETIKCNLSNYITEAGTYYVEIRVYDHDGFSDVNHFYVYVENDETTTTTTTSTTSTTDATTTSTGTTDTSTSTSEDNPTLTVSTTPSLGFFMEIFALIAISTLIIKRRTLQK